ncbi:glycosyltransferase [Subdoligranulum variabile]|uniref:Glycosyltransferase, group 1 family protein n=1 Tax=Subdoligranulum variabile DSM 15176 TaxID=411471 RepID=D1PNR9_9FIRM|nr:glycosyltransferase [Subdoligranulum variabile]EFB76204.1 glycosyltransferase, group 1 family protein [Subdoligranulum variabile DSM 15176]UWP68838.1 glycosyltransferase [Subdoligranulum variabile]
MAPIRVLQVMPAMDAGGMETFVMNVYRVIDREQVQFDFLYHYNKSCFFDDEIQSLGGRIFKMTVRQDNNLPRYLRELRELFADHPEWHILHGHYSGFGMFYNTVARRAGIPVRVGHSHNTAYEHNLVGTLDRLMSLRFSAGLTDRFACSELAGKMLFGKDPFTVLPNGIDTALFAARDPQRRALLRGDLGVADNEILFGHVGRFTAQKNHPGLLRIFAAVRKRLPKARLVLLGGGPAPYIEQMQALTRELQLGDSVIFAGVRSNIQGFYDAMDAFLLPSLFEGLPVVLVEAQTAGLPCFVADTIDRGAAFTDRVRFLPLNDPDAWANAIAAASFRRDPNARRKAVEAGYDIHTSADILQAFYLRRYAEVTP